MVKNNGNVPIPVWVKTQVVPGGNVGQSTIINLPVGVQQGFVTDLTMPGTPGAATLGGEVHANLSAYGGQADQIMHSFPSMGEAISIVAPPNPLANAISVVWE